MLTCVKAVRRTLPFVLLSLFAAEAASAQSLYEMPEGVESRWASGENPTGEKGKAGQTNAGRKGSPTVPCRDRSRGPRRIPKPAGRSSRWSATVAADRSRDQIAVSRT